MEEIETLKAEYYHEKQKHVKYTARLSKEQSKADTLTKLGKLQRRRRKQKRLVKEAKNEIGSLQSQLKQVEDDLDIVAKQNESILACIQAIAERLEKEKIVQTEAKRPLDEDLPALDKSLCVQKKKKKKHKKKKVEESRGCEPTLPCARQRPTYLLNRMQEYIELQCTTSAGQELLDRRQRFSHASEFSAKELSVRSARSCHRHGRHHRVKPS
ncbi:expressed unknown protein [Seminavis robusta]|uniref:Uncharacterized protein n=1 Tax=Seminavis robusta TaxID=568900 RepID=A0A9N8DU67_9STRA|nr:expressed unknown protein [Seminavis robusta]|eukprot:Sro293_g109980.1 n/a (213) ;mRNA; r:51284-51922